MNYFYTLSGVLLLLSIYTVVGDLFVDFLPFSQRAMGRMYLRPVFGFAIFLLCSVLAGWVVGERTYVVVPVTALLVAAALFLCRDRAALLRKVLFVAGVGTIVSLVFLLSILLVNVYCPVSDTFTYLVHAQWLAGHPFRELCARGFTDIAETQVRIYQDMQQRMGVSFLFGWVTALLPFKGSYEVYPIHIATILTVGALGISAQVYALLKRQRWLSALFGTAAVVSTCGFTFGACYGFMPQSGALCLLPSVGALLTNLPTMRYRLGKLAFRLFPLALVLAAEGYAYHEVMPYTLLMVGAWFGVNLIVRDDRKALLRQGAVFAGMVLILWNHEILRMAHSLRAEVGIAPGWPVSWPAIVYFAHTIGLHSGSGDTDYWIVPNKFVSWVITYACLGVILAAAGRLLFSRRSVGTALHLVVFCLTGLGFFLYFRYVAESPWHDAFGNSFLQIKLTNWTSPMFLSLLGYGLLKYAGRRGVAVGVAALLLAWMGMSFYHQGKIVVGRAIYFNKYVGVKKDGYRVFEHFRKAVLEKCGGQYIYLNLNGPEVKQRQLFVYFLHDQKLVGDWSDDGYICGLLDPGWKESGGFQRCHYCIQLKTKNSAVPSLFQEGKYELVEMPPQLISVQAIEGGYGTENDANGWWVWTAHEVKTTFHLVGEMPKAVRLKFEAVPHDEKRNLTIRIRTGGPDIVRTTVIIPGQNSYVSDPFSVSSENIEAEIDSDGVPTRLGPRDPRSVLFMAANVRLEPVPAKALPQ